MTRAAARRLTLSGLIGLAAISCAAENPVEGVLSRLSGNLAGIRTVETSFVQVKHMAILQRELTMRGKVFLARPDRLAWHVDEPIRYTMIMDGKEVRQWDEASGRTSRIPLDTSPALQVATDQMRQWFAGDFLRLRSEYRVVVDRERPARLVFEPRSGHPAGDFLKRVRVAFTEDERYLSSIVIEETGGDRTELRFYDTLLDEPLPASAWVPGAGAGQ